MKSRKMEERVVNPNNPVQEESQAPKLASVEETAKKRTEDKTLPARKKLRFPTLIDLLALLGIWYLLQLVGLLVVKLIGVDFPDWAILRGEVEPNMAQQIELGRFNAILYGITMVMMIACTLLYRRIRRGTKKTLRFSIRGLNPILLLWGFVMMLAAGIVIEPVVDLLPMPSSLVYGRGVWSVLCLVVMAPVLEEILCRGIVLESVRAKYGVVVALFLSALFFSVLHGNLALAFNAFVLGLVLGFIYIETDSILSVIILHALNNGVAFLLIMIGVNDMTLHALIDNRTLYAVVYTVALLLFIASAYMIYRQLGKMKAQEKNRVEA